MIKTFTIGGIKWTVKEDNNRLEEMGLLGLCETSKSLISIFSEVDTMLVEQTIYHEAVHAILESMGENRLSRNERFVQNFALLLHQFEITKI
jgi:hypothetical protein